MEGSVKIDPLPALDDQRPFRKNMFPPSEKLETEGSHAPIPGSAS
jgi:hypothetical protein